MKYIDMHCDTLSIGLGHHKSTITNLEGTMVDVERLLKVGAGAQFFAMFVPQRDVPEWYGTEEMPEHEVLLGMMCDIFWKTIEKIDITCHTRIYNSIWIPFMHVFKKETCNKTLSLNCAL